jgi:GNAT superfamily N-acetyltransferase
MLEIVKITNGIELKNEVLSEMACLARSGRSREFVALVGSSESAFLSYEDTPNRSIGFVYEIYVLPEFRRQGIGANLLSYAESLATELGCIRIQLKVHAFDRTVDMEWLASWYKNKGYVKKNDEPEIFEKLLIKNAPNTSFKPKPLRGSI